MSMGSWTRNEYMTLQVFTEIRAFACSTALNHPAQTLSMAEPIFSVLLANDGIRRLGAVFATF